MRTHKQTTPNNAVGSGAIVTALCLLACGMSRAQSPVSWLGANNVTATTNWSDSANWLGGAPSANDVKFFNFGTTAAPGVIDNVVDADTSVNSVNYGQTNGFHTTLIPTGVTLSVAVNGAGAGQGFFVGTPLNQATTLVGATNVVTGGGTLLMANGGALIVHQGANQDDAHNVLLDLSGLNTLIMTHSATVQGFVTVASGFGNANKNRDCGTLYLARTNLLNLGFNFRIGDINGPASPILSAIYLGQTNSVAVATGSEVVAGRQGGTNLLTFKPGLVDPAAFFIGTNIAGATVAPLTRWDIGLAVTAHCVGTNDFTGGTITAIVDAMRLGRAAFGTSNAIGVLTYDGGTMSANTVVCGNQTVSAGGFGLGIINVNSNAAFGRSATLVVTNSLTLAAVTGTLNPNTAGTLNINGGTVNANSIIAGGGASRININGGALNLANTLGGPGAALSNFNLTNATLQFPVPTSLQAPAVVTSLTTGGATNLINISSIPLYASAFPVTFKLVGYTSQSGTFNIGLGALPSSTPAFTGYITNDATSSSVNLVLTGGRPPSGQLTWVGQPADGDWDVSSTANWNNGTGATGFNQLDFTRFDDTAVQGAVNLVASPLLPGSVLVTNTTLAYTFAGSGYLSGPFALTKQGTGTLLIDNSGAGGSFINDFSGGVTISAGTVQVGNGDAAGSLGSGPIINNGALVCNRSDTFVMANGISGSGTLKQEGGGTLQLSGANSFTGTILITSNSTLQINSGTALGSAAGGTTITNGSTLDVNAASLGANNLTVVGEVITVSGSGVGGSGAIVNNGTIAQGNALQQMTLADNTTIGGSARWDLRAAASPLVATLNTGGHAYNLTKVGANFISIANVTVDSKLGNVDVQSGTLEFNGNTTSLGDSTKTLSVESGGTFQMFAATNKLNKNILLNDGSILANASGADTIVGPITLTNSDLSATPYCSFNIGGTSLTVSGPLTGNGILYKTTGASPLILNGNSPAFAGGVYVGAGTLTLSSGLTNGLGVNVGAGKLILNGTLSGAGLTNQPNATIAGTGTNSGPMDLGGSFLPGDAGVVGTFSAAGGLVLETTAVLTNDLSSVTNAGQGLNDLVQVVGDLNLSDSASIYLNPLGPLQTNNPYTLFTYTGNLIGGLGNFVQTAFPTRYDTFILSNVTTTSPKQVKLAVSGPGPALLVWNNAGGDGEWNNAFGSQNWSNAISGAAADNFYPFDSVLFNDAFISSPTWTNLIDLASNVVVTPTLVTNNSSANYTIQGAGKISGGASLVKLGTGTLTLSTVSDFTGAIALQGGTLALTGGGSVSKSTNLTLTAGTKLDVSGRTDKTLTLASGQTLQGNGIINGSLTNAAGATVSPGGLGSIGTLTVTNGVTLSGTTIMELSKASTATNDAIIGAARITYGGTLNVTNLAGTLAAGDTFKLFSAATYSGTFTLINLPPLATGLAWTNTLATAGTLSVVATVNTSRTNLTALVAGNQLTLSWPADHTGWRLQVQTNAIGAGLGTNWFTVAGSTNVNSVMITIDRSNGVVFYRMAYP